MKEHICPLCEAVNEDYRVVSKTSSAYALIPIEPIVPGHVMVLPQRHARLEELSGLELGEIRDLTVGLKDRLLVLYPQTPPFVSAMMDTPHASIPGHVHYHLIPCPANLRVLINRYDPNILVRKKAEFSDLEEMARILRG